MEVPRFCLAYTSPSHVCSEFVRGLIGMFTGPLAPAVESVIQIVSGPSIAEARDQITRMFLDSSRAPVLLMVDTDMAFTAAHVARLLQLSEQAGVVGALYSGLVPGGSLERVVEAGMFAQGTFTPIELDEAQAELVDVDALGAGLLVVRRVVFVDIAKRGPGEPLPWWQDVVRDGGVVQEDFEFCLRARAAGHRVAVAPGVRVPHLKTIGIA